MPNSQLAEFLLQHNQKQSAIFCNPDAALSRRQYRSKHPTAVAAMKCMDGRLNLSIITKTPPGIIQPFRNIGGMFDLGWPYFGELLNDWVRNNIFKGSDCMILVTYHWSKGDLHRGCKGFHYDVKTSFKYTRNLKKQVERVFGNRHTAVYPIQIGIETDEDALTLHGENGETLNLAEETKMKEEKLSLRLQKLFPDMKSRILEDLIPFLIGNQKHVEEVRKTKRPIEETQHKEQILAIGRGFDWLHLPNKALIIGPYSYNLGESIVTAAKILMDNLKKHRIPANNGIVLMSSAAYRDEAGPERFRAIEKTKSLADFSMETIKTYVPQLIPHIKLLRGVVNLNTRFFTKIDAE